MLLDRVIKYANIYYGLTKTAGILENMAARVLWSTMPWQVQQESQISLTSLIPGAKELLRYGRIAAIDEADRHTDVKEQLESIHDPVAFFKAAEQAFLTGNWGSQYGGKSWADICSTLASLADTIRRAEKATNYDEQNKALNEMVAYMNMVDATMHNSGMLLDKLLDIEAGERGVDDLDAREDMYNKVLKVMDAKELNEPQDVMSVVLPIVKTMPERFLPFKDWASKYYQQAYRPGNIPEQLSDVRKQKLINEADNAIDMLSSTLDHRYLDNSVDALLNIAEFLEDNESKNLIRPLIKLSPEEALPHLDRWFNVLVGELTRR